MKKRIQLVAYSVDPNSEEAYQPLCALTRDIESPSLEVKPMVDEFHGLVDKMLHEVWLGHRDA